MFRLFGSKRPDFVPANSDRFISILSKLNIILAKNGHIGQAEFIRSLIKLLHEKSLNEFVKAINSLDMWGGAGAVWEVYIGATEEAKTFESEMVKLIDLMEESNILGSGIKPIRRIFTHK